MKYQFHIDGWLIKANTEEEFIEELKRFGYYNKYLEEQNKKGDK